MTPAILWQDDDLVVVEKPAGVATVPLKGGRPSLGEVLSESFPELKSLPDRGACHRLDNDTTGLVVFARNRETYEKMREAFSKDKIAREYVALVEGIIERPIKIEWPIGPDPKSAKKVKVYRNLAEARRAKALPAVTSVTPLKKTAQNSLVQVKIRGGRRHQVRAHLAAIGHPVLKLHASRLIFTHPRLRKRLEINSRGGRNL